MFGGSNLSAKLLTIPHPTSKSDATKPRSPEIPREAFELYGAQAHTQRGAVTGMVEVQHRDSF